MHKTYFVNRELTQRRQQRQREQPKSKIGLDKIGKTILHLHHTLCTFLCRHCMTMA